ILKNLNDERLHPHFVPRGWNSRSSPRVLVADESASRRRNSGEFFAWAGNAKIRCNTLQTTPIVAFIRINDRLGSPEGILNGAAPHVTAAGSRFAPISTKALEMCKVYTLYKCANRMYRFGIPVVPRLIYYLVRIFFGGHVPYTAKIG